jgi:lipopolysaccharide export system ATP-binding protein
VATRASERSRPSVERAGSTRHGDEERVAVEGLIAQGLVKRFRNRVVVDHVSLDIHRGEVVGLLGPNGAGKTTSFYMIVGLLRPEGGRIYLEGEEITDLPMYKRCRRGLGYLPQESSVFRRMTVAENLLAILETLDLAPEERTERLRELLAELDLTRLAHHRAYTLSGGERRRLEITRALVTSPRYLLLDEPFTGIDPIAIGDIQEIVGRLKDRGIGLLITDHNVRETLAITDRAYIVHHGRILASGTATELANNATAREIYLGERFSL